jgi:arginyl-tRNA synthetase
VQTPRAILTERFAAALATALPDARPAGELVVPTAQAEHGDYQCNLALGLAKQLKLKPRDVAAKILEHLRIDDICAPPEVAGPGFINLRLLPEFLGRQIEARATDPRAGVAPTATPRTIVVDYSSPNVAKPMHVGHIRSTVIGDAIARMLRFRGHRVIADNHIGDWGTQFGKLLLGYKELADPAALKADPVQELKRIYKVVHTRSKSDPAYEERAREEVVRLQAEDPEQIRIWREIIDLSKHVAEEIYDRLDIHFDVWHGESFYNPMLGAVVDEFLARGIAREDQGAVVVFFDEPDLVERPLIIRKRDGASLYSTSDLATIKYRDETWHPDELVYVVGAPQQLHFKQVFAAARKWGYTSMKLEHAWFGSILGTDNKPYKTREGEPPELSDLLDEAEQRALSVVAEKNPDLPPERQREVARVVGLGAVKYADLCQTRTADYVFSWDRMLALQGNTAPYMQYAYARIHGIAQKAGVELEKVEGGVALAEPAELGLARILLRFGDVVEEAAESLRPHLMTTYLYDLASAFSTFFESCPVAKAEEPIRTARLMLCRLTAQTLRVGLELLGIETLARI